VTRYAVAQPQAGNDDHVLLAAVWPEPPWECRSLGQVEKLCGELVLVGILGGLIKRLNRFAQRPGGLSRLTVKTVRAMGEASARTGDWRPPAREDVPRSVLDSPALAAT
jgi:hypothetical protein